MATYYVATNGSDSNNGSLSNPWRNLHVAANRLGNNDTLYVRGGTYALPNKGEITINKTGVTMSAYNNEVPIIDGRAVWNRDKWLQNGCIASNPVGTSEYTPLIGVDATGVTLKGLHMRDSAGEGVRIRAKNCTVDDCHVDTSYGSGISFMENTSGIAKDCSVNLTGRKGTQAALRGRFIKDELTFLRCKVSNGGGEGLSSVQSDHITMRDCEIWDNNKTQIYLEGTRHSVVDGCLIYCTSQIQSGEHSYSEGIHIASELYPQGAWVCEDIEITNNLIVGCGPNLKFAGGLHRSVVVGDWGLRDVRIFHNTFVNARANACLIFGNQSPANNNGNNTPCWFANNIVVQEDSLPITSSFSGTNYSKFTFSHNVWSKQPSVVDFRSGATDTVGSAGLADPPAKLERPSEMNLNDYKLASGSAAINAATKTYDAASGTSVTEDFFDSDRGASPDRGFHEYGGAGAEKILVAGYSTSPGSTINAGEAITFSDNSTTGGGVSITSREWVFDGGSTPSLTAASPVVTYPVPGVYDVTYTVHDSVNNRHSIASGTVTVKAEDGGDIAPLKTNVVNFAGGAASFAHGLDSPPKAILFFMGRATADDTPVDGAGMSIGMYAANGSAAIAASNPNGTADKQGLRKLAAGVVLEDLEDGVTLSVASVSATEVALTWTGSPPAYKCMALCFGGGNVSNATVDLHNFANSTSAEKAGEYTLLFAIGAGNAAAGEQKWGATLSFGVASVNGSQGVAAFAEPRSSSLKEIVQSDMVAYDPTRGWGVSAEFREGYKLYAFEKSNSAVAVLALKVDANALVGIYPTPTTTDAKEYGAEHLIDFDPATMLAVLSNLASPTLAAGENAGYFGVYATDGTDERTIGVTNEDSALPVGSSSITDGGWVQRADDGSALMSGSVALGTAKFTMTMTDADATERMFLALLLEGVATTTDPKAAFVAISSNYDGEYYYETDLEIVFTNLSTEGAAPINYILWRFGDGNESSDESPYHTYITEGSYTIELFVSDENDNDGYATKTIYVYQAPPIVDPIISVKRGTVPFETEIDISGATWGELDIDWETSFIGLWRRLEYLPYSIVEPIWLAGDSGDVDGVVTFELTDPGRYGLCFKLFAASGYGPWGTNDIGAEIELYNGPIVANEPSSLYLEYQPSNLSFVGPLEIELTMRGARVDVEWASYQWNFGDGATLENAPYQVRHTYAAVDTPTSYDLNVDIVFPNDDDTLNLDEEEYEWQSAVTVYPPTVPPIPLQTIAAQWQTCREHVGDLTGAVWARQDAPNGNVYKTELSHTWAVNMTPRVFEDGVELTARASVALCQANPGSYYATNAAGEIVIYVHPLQSDNPAANDNLYRWID